MSPLLQQLDVPIHLERKLMLGRDKEENDDPIIFYNRVEKPVLIINTVMPKGEKLFLDKQDLIYTCTACGKAFRGTKISNLFKLHLKYHHPTFHQEVEGVRDTARYVPRTTESEFEALTSM